MPNIIRQNEDGQYYIAYIDEDYWEKNSTGDAYWKMVGYKNRTPNEKQVGDKFESLAAAKRWMGNSYINKHGLKEAESSKKWHTKQHSSHISYIYVCHDCKIIMYHSMLYCFNCPAKIQQTKITSQEILELLNKGYKVGW